MSKRDFPAAKTLSPKQPRFIECGFWLLSAYPLVWLCQLYGVGVYVLSILGQWPDNENTGADPEVLNDLGALSSQIRFLTFGRILLVAWPLIYLLWTFLLLQKRSFLRRHGWGLMLAAIGVVLMGWQLTRDPAGLWMWVSRINSR
jgi:hypothetical protein